MPKFAIFNDDCIKGAKKHLESNSVDLILTDPPYGIAGDKLDRHYNRDESNVVDGYIEVPKETYFAFTLDWMIQAARVLRPNGMMYIISGWSNLGDVLRSVEEINRGHRAEGNATDLLEVVNHVIWKYNFGVFAKRKFVTSHYHIPVIRKIPKRGEAAGNPVTFNYMSDERKGKLEEIQQTLIDDRKIKKNAPLSKAAYRDMEDVWDIKREYRPGELKNKNQLPTELVRKIITYSSNKGDIVADFFMGGFTTALVAKEMGRIPVGFEQNPIAYKAFLKKLVSA